MIQVENLGFTFQNNETGECSLAGRFLHDINFSVKMGEFVTLCGKNGCGKSTLLRILKKEICPSGNLEGRIILSGRDRNEYSESELVTMVGFVGQNPEHQCVTDKVWHELAFGLENLGIRPELIRSRVAGIASYFGIEEWYDRRVDELSGGQKQMLNLASVMIMQPKLLLLDEPTSQLDPIASERFLQMVRKLNTEFGLTVLIAEHNPDETLTISDKIIWMEQGTLCFQGIPGNLGELIRKDPDCLLAMPCMVRVAYACNQQPPYQLGIADIKHLVISCLGKDSVKKTELTRDGELSIKAAGQSENTADSGMRNRTVGKAVLTLKNLRFDYRQNEVPSLFMRRNRDTAAKCVLNGTNLSLYEGEIYCLLGGNGSGKTTLLKTILGICRPSEGKILLHGEKMTAENKQLIGYLPQDVETMFVTERISDDFKLANERTSDSPNDERASDSPNDERTSDSPNDERASDSPNDEGARDSLADEGARDLPNGMRSNAPHGERRNYHCGEVFSKEIQAILKRIMDRHPYEISGGERQLAALAKVLLRKPKILLLDEPVKGMDAWVKSDITRLLDDFRKAGGSILIVTHDMEFAASIADRCGLFFRGEVVSEAEPKEFLAGNSFYGTAAVRICAGTGVFYDTTEKLVKACDRAVGTERA